MPVAAVSRTDASYPSAPPFDPDEAYPELRGPAASSPNPAYRAVRAALALLHPPGPEHGEGADWNPLGHVVRPGQTVFVKPNLVDHEHRYGGDVWSVITHPSVVRAVVDYVALALRGDGRIVVGDNPHVDCDWSHIRELYGADRLVDRVADAHGVDVDFVDLRSWEVRDLHDYGWRRGRSPLPGDPRGRREVILERSYLDDRPRWLFRGTLNERGETIRAHRRGHHRYVFSATIADADTYVSVPKLKSHAKVGATLNVKGLVGTIADKNALVHWSIGHPRFGGDEYPTPDDPLDHLRLYWQHAVNDLLPSRLLLAIRDRCGATALGDAYRRLVTTDAQRRRLLRGAWEGNDTTWRMAADVHDAFVGSPGAPRRRTYSVIDGIVGGDTDGPHFPHRVPAGTVIAAPDLLVADLVAARLMDFDPSAIRYLAALTEAHGLAPDSIEVRGVDGDVFAPDRRHLGFRPPNRWPGLSLAGLAPGGDLLADVVGEGVAA